MWSQLGHFCSSCCLWRDGSDDASLFVPKAESKEAPAVLGQDGRGRSIVVPGRNGCYLAGFRGIFPAVSASVDVIGPPIAGTVDSLGRENAQLSKYLYNDVKVCPGCGRPCAWAQKACQACCSCLSDVPVTQTENVLMGFIFGVERTARCPLHISIRRQTEDVLCFDDLLAMSSCHLNVLSTRHYLPDWRWLLRDPARAAELLQALKTEAWQATLAFLNDRGGWRHFNYREGVTEDMVRDNVIVGFNSPPSQFQLHMQYITLPLLPCHHQKLLARTHAQKGRWFPLEYVEQCLGVLTATKSHFHVQRETSIEDVIEHFNAKGVIYEQIWERCYERYCASYVLLANWKPADFDYVVRDGQVYDIAEVLSDGSLVCGEPRELDAQRVQDQDKARLQNYGRPYDANNEPRGNYYKHYKACKIGDGGVQIWPGLDAD